MSIIISKCKYYIQHEQYEDLEEYYQEIKTEINEHIFQQIFIFCCLRQREEMVIWLFQNIYQKMDVVSRIALRPALTYGKYIYKKPFPITIPTDPKDY